MKKLLLLMLLLSVALVFSNACSTTKNTGEAIGEGTKEAAEETGEAVKEGAEAVGDKAEDVGEAVKEGAESAGQTVEDASITAAVKMKMADDESVRASAIDVDTEDGVVTLRGLVRSQAELDRAVSIAQSAAGVKRVVSQLTIQP